MTTRILLICSLFVACSWHAMAATGDACATADQAHYNKVATTDQCKMLCDGISQGVGATGCGPVYFTEQHGATDFLCAIEKAQSGCVTATDIKIQESNSSTAGAPNVWTTVCTLTGVLDPLVQECSFGRTPKGAVRTTFSTTTGWNAACTDVDITCTLKRPAKARATP